MPERAAETRTYGTGVAILAGWRFCPRCRAELEHLGARVECSGCGFVRYANPLPAVAALIVDEEGRLLLGRRAFEPDVGRWDTIGGFLEEGEDAFEALHREVLEETGLVVEVRGFVGAFSDRYGSGDDAPTALNLVFEARLVSGNPLPADDVSEVAWFTRDSLPTGDELAFRWIARALAQWAPLKNRP
jgi:ADP-ribose pyrophosphatase YjhB (NUDIX family)